MPRGDKSAYSSKQKRQAGHIEESEREQGRSEEDAERIAWATVNKQDGGGTLSGSGRKQAGARVSSKPAAKKTAASKAVQRTASKKTSTTKAGNKVAPKTTKKTVAKAGKKSAARGSARKKSARDATKTTASGSAAD